MSEKSRITFASVDQAKLPFNLVLQGNAGAPAGTIKIDKELVTFEGNFDESAQVFIDHLARRWSQQWRDLEKRANEFVRSGARNYLELGYNVPEMGEFTVTIQRKEGKTPGERIAELEAVVDQRNGECVRLINERDALREEQLNKGSNTRAAADIYFQLVEECQIPPGGSLVEYVRELQEKAERCAA